MGCRGIVGVTLGCPEDEHSLINDAASASATQIFDD